MRIISRLLSLLILYIFFQQTGSGQIRFSNPNPSGFSNIKVLFTDSRTGFLLNDDGSLLRTLNQGATWATLHNFYLAKSFDFHDSIGVVAAYNAVYVSSDNGTTWQKRSVVFTDNYVGVNVIGRDTIVMAGTNKVYKSFNRGVTWQTIDLGNIITKSFQFVTGSVGYVGKSNTALLKTTDGGQTWQELLKTGYGSNAFTAIHFLNTDTGYVYRQTDTMYKTTNGGASWQRTFMSVHMNAIHFANSLTGYAAGESNVLSRTTDGGATWNYLPPSGGYTTCTGVYFVSADTGVAIGYFGKIMKTVNGGQSWQANTFTYGTIQALAFPPGNNAYATDNNYVYKSVNGGQNWNALPLTVGLPLYNSYFRFARFFSADTGLLTASNPARIFKTNNGGQTWRTISFNWAYGGIYDDNTGISFINDSTGFVLFTYSDGFGLFKTKNRGETWIKVDSNRTGNPNYQKICFINEKTGYATRGYSLYRTTDSAKTWSLLFTNDYIITALDFTSARNGCIGATGVKRTIDSGRTWVAVPGVYDNNVYDLKFTTPAIGYFTSTRVGAATIYQTQDSGRSWMFKDGTASLGNTIAFYKDTLVYTGGANGIVASIPVDTTYTSKSNCQGESLSFYADMPASYSNFDAYQWQVDTGTGFINIQDNEIYSGVNSYRLIFNSVPPGWVNYKYRCRLDYFNYTRTYQFHFKAQQWTGAINSAWENPGNWSCGLVPDANTDVVITNGPVTIQSNVAVRSLKLSPGVVLTVAPGYTLNITH